MNRGPTDITTCSPGSSGKRRRRCPAIDLRSRCIRPGSMCHALRRSRKTGAIQTTEQKAPLAMKHLIIVIDDIIVHATSSYECSPAYWWPRGLGVRKWGSRPGPSGNTTEQKSAAGKRIGQRTAGVRAYVICKTCTKCLRAVSVYLSPVCVQR